MVPVIYICSKPEQNAFPVHKIVPSFHSKFFYPTNRAAPRQAIAKARPITFSAMKVQFFTPPPFSKIPSVLAFHCRFFYEVDCAGVCINASRSNTRM
jgi:hypothetical protein